jgi:mRNA interferase RelE/StbE
MKWRILFAHIAEKELARFSSETRLRLGRAIRALRDDPIPPLAKRLKGRAELRPRVGDYPVLYTLDHSGSVLMVPAIGHRREVYR